MHGDHYDFSWGFQHRVVVMKMGMPMIVVKKQKQNGEDIEDLKRKKITSIGIQSMMRVPANFILPKETFYEGVKENEMCASR